MDQRSPEWYAARVGKVTASRVHDIVATTRSGGFTSPAAKTTWPNWCASG